mmetsp:Transcript_26193/g.78586  ORF Transcript_26193/g.78586 Transcript_26193/m.78586 type:complete len:108 (+) Transcript_26193:173-496(+)
MQRQNLQQTSRNMAAMFGGARTRSDDTSALAYTAPKQPGKEKPTPAPAPAAAPAPAQPTAADTKAEAAEIVANAKKEYKARLEDREKAKTATPEDLQAMINAKLSVK